MVLFEGNLRIMPFKAPYNLDLDTSRGAASTASLGNMHVVHIQSYTTCLTLLLCDLSLRVIEEITGILNFCYEL